MFQRRQAEAAGDQGDCDGLFAPQRRWKMMEKEGRRPGWGWGYELKCYGRLGK